MNHFDQYARVRDTVRVCTGIDLRNYVEYLFRTLFM